MMSQIKIYLGNKKCIINIKNINFRYIWVSVVKYKSSL